MRLPPFDYYAPETLIQALKLKSELGGAAAVLAGGTDLVVNLKHRLLAPAAVISIRNVKEIRGIDVKPDAVLIRAGTSLADIAQNQTVKQHFPILVKAILGIGAIGIQHFRGTIGGNLCLTPRCILYNQTLFWRKSKGSCHRTGAKDCLAQPGSDSCQAICSGDTVPVLTALSAQITIAGAGGSRTIPVSEFFSGDGQNPFNMTRDEIVTAIRLPIPWMPISWSYQRLSMRSAVDFPLINTACVAIVEYSKVEHFRLVLCAAGPAPIIVKEAENAVKGRVPSPEMANLAAEAASKAVQGVIVPNASTSKEYRVKMAGVVARRAVKEALNL